MVTWYPDQLARRQHYEEGPARPALVVRIDAVVGRLLADEIQGLVAASGHKIWPFQDPIYAFGGDGPSA